MNLKTFGLIALLGALLFIAASVLAGVKAERLKMDVDETCIEYIEEAAASVDGVIETIWDEETGELEIVFEEKRTNLDEIERAISQAGFNTPNYEASEEAAGNIPSACKSKNSPALKQSFNE